MSNVPHEITKRPVVNIKSTPITLAFAEGTNSVSRVMFPPGVPVEIPAAYALPQAIAANREPKPSVVDMLSNGAVIDLSDKRAEAIRLKIEKDASKPDGGKASR